MRLFLLSILLLTFSSCGFKEIEPLRAEALNSWKNILTEARSRSDEVPKLVNLIRKIDKEQTLPIEEAMASTVSGRILAHKKSDSTLPLSPTAIRELIETQTFLRKNLVVLSEACTWNESVMESKEFVARMNKLDSIESNMAQAVLKYQKEQARFNQLISDFPLSWINKYYWKFTTLPAIKLK